MAKLAELSGEVQLRLLKSLGPSLLKLVECSLEGWSREEVLEHWLELVVVGHHRRQSLSSPCLDVSFSSSLASSKFPKH